MAQYTLTIKQIIENNIDIFTFHYPFFDESYRKTFENNFINHFYFDEIGLETVGKFKHRLKIKLNLIMPYYNKIFISQALEQRILDNYDVTETFEKEGTGTRKGSMIEDRNSNATNNNENLNAISNTPVTRVDISSSDFITNLNKDTGKGTSVTTDKNTNTNSVTEGNTENWVRTMKGNIGIQTDADAIKKYENCLRIVELEVFSELEELFMGVY